MQHITEGLLHAHLDGALGSVEQLQWVEAEAHLEVCDDCRRRLAEAAELRDAARDLLAGAAGPTAPAGRPVFDELVARAQASRVDTAADRKPSARAGGAWWRMSATLGWAASLVLAAGAGWISRQLVVEQGLDAPAVIAEQDGPVGRTEGEGVVLDDIREDPAREGARARRDAAAAPAAPEPQAGVRAEAEHRQEERPEAEDLQDKAQGRTDAEPRADADGAIFMRVAPLADGAEAIGDARCYAVSPVAGDGGDAATGTPETLRLAPDGTAILRLDGRPMVGFWERAAADSVHLRVTDGEQWRELALVEVASGLRGDVELESVDCP